MVTRIGLSSPEPGDDGWYSQPCEVAIDPGSANLRVAVRGKGVVLDDPAVVAVDRATRQPRAFGLEAKQMVARTPARIIAVRPLAGADTDLALTTGLLRYAVTQMLDASPRTGLRPPPVALQLSAKLDEWQRRALAEVVEQATGRHCRLGSAPRAAALSAGVLETPETTAMALVIGASATEAAVLAYGWRATPGRVSVGGDDLDRAIIDMVRRDHQLLIGERTAEAIKRQAGSAVPLNLEREVHVRGRDVETGLPRVVMLTTVELRAAMMSGLTRIAALAGELLARTEPALVAELRTTGIWLAGGGALLPGLGTLIEEATGIPARLVPDPQVAVVQGLLDT